MWNPEGSGGAVFAVTGWFHHCGSSIGKSTDFELSRVQWSMGGYKGVPAIELYEIPLLILSILGMVI